MTKHTPGPWHRDEDYPIYVWGPNQKMVADLPSGDEDAYLARMRGVGRGATREEQDANCTLIAAAPELLQALKDSRLEHYACEDSWYSCPKAPDGCANEAAGHDCNCGADEWNARIDAVIAKAEPPQ